MLEEGTFADHVLALEDKVDHLAAYVDVRLLPVGATTDVSAVRSRPCFNRDGLRLPAVQAAIAKEWSAAPPLPRE